MSKIPAFQLCSDLINTDIIYKTIVNNVDIDRFENQFVISYDKFPDKLPDIDNILKSVYHSYFENMKKEGYTFDYKGELLIEKYLVVCPKNEYKEWSQCIRSKDGKKMGISLNVHIFLNDSNMWFDYFCPFLDDVQNVKVSKGQVVCYPNFWGSLYRHPCSNKEHVSYLRCVIGLPL